MTDRRESQSTFPSDGEVALIERRYHEAMDLLVETGLPLDIAGRLGEALRAYSPVAWLAHEVRRLRSEITALNVMGKGADEGLSHLAKVELTDLSGRLEWCERALCAVAAMQSIPITSGQRPALLR